MTIFRHLQGIEALAALFAETIAMTKMNKNNDILDLTYLKAVVLLSVRTRSGVGGAS